ncbi:RHE_PE00001 family protein [Aquamicrobium soli]|uniref:RHE_PE00001 family protein n=1 Tax=Aquamicrobium soli TaxID=1811518 RepID=A0ABV7KB71_9HYPH
MIASVSPILVKVIKVLQSGYLIPDPLPWPEIGGPLATAEDALARLDERLAKSPIREGWASRTHFADAAATLWLEGELVHLDDLVLHDARMDIRAPTHELTRAHAVLRMRRRIGGAEPDWALSPSGLASLRGGRSAHEPAANRGGEDSLDQDDGEEEHAVVGSAAADVSLDQLFADVDAAIASSDRVLMAGASTAQRPSERDPLVYDVDWDEDARLAEWRTIVDRTRALPSTLAAAIAAQAWIEIAPLQHTPWLGRLLAAALLRERGKARAHLPCLSEGLKAIPRERRRPRDAAGQLRVELEAIAAAADAGLKSHDRWLAARTILARKLDGRRSTSRLPALLDYVLTRPVVSAGMIAEELRITSRAAHDLVAELGLREATGRGSYRAWGIL